MSVQPPYPGVHIEELPSGTHTITGVATSITAFIGRALCGPVNLSVPITSYSDYERIFGGLWIDSTMSYAVRDFYNNGGSQATIVRLTRNATTAAITLVAGIGSPPGSLVLLANSPGAWGSALSASVNYSTQDPTAAPLSPPDASVQTSFNLVIYESGTQVEQFLNVTLNPADIKFLPRVLAQSSSYVAIGKDGLGNWILPSSIPLETSNPVAASSGLDGDTLTSAEYLGNELKKEGLFAFKTPALFNLLCIPPPV
ncbi:MAG: phage tail sheath family protein, partial [Bacteroidota bacterium]